jgi:hypothetical protein
MVAAAMRHIVRRLLSGSIRSSTPSSLRGPRGGVEYGAFMEQSGRNRWQPVANATASKTARIGKSVAVGCDRLPDGAHGKDGVAGSIPAGAPPARETGLFEGRGQRRLVIEASFEVTATR